MFQFRCHLVTLMFHMNLDDLVYPSSFWNSVDGSIADSSSNSTDYSTELAHSVDQSNEAEPSEPFQQSHIKEISAIIVPEGKLETENQEVSTSVLSEFIIHMFTATEILMVENPPLPCCSRTNFPPFFLEGGIAPQASQCYGPA